MNSYIPILAALSAAGAVYFTVEWFTALARRRNMTYLERTALDVEAESSDSSKPNLFDRVLKDLGWTSDPAFPLLAIAALYLLLASALSALGMSGFFAAAIALPSSFAAARIVMRTYRRKQQQQFNMQLVQALELLAGQMEAGNGVQRSIEMMTPSLPDPLRGEFEGALEATVASKDLIEALRDVRTRYPSKALDLFIAALDIEKITAGQLGRPVREAAELLRKDFELVGEISAETAQQKLAAIVMILGVGAISVALIAGLETEVFTTPLGLILLTVGGANFMFGIYRVSKMLSSIQGGE